MQLQLFIFSRNVISSVSLIYSYICHNWTATSIQLHRFILHIRHIYNTHAHYGRTYRHTINEPFGIFGDRIELANIYRIGKK